MAKKSDIELLKGAKRVVKVDGKEYKISELTTELGLSLLSFLGQVDFTTQGKVKELLKEVMNQEKTEPEEFTKKFIDYFCDYLFSFINKHTQDYFYEFIALALSDDKNEFTIEQAKKIKLKDAMRIFNTILFDEDAQEFIRDAFFLPPPKGGGG